MLVLGSLAEEPQHVHGPALSEKVNDISHTFSNKYSIHAETARCARNERVGRQTLPLYGLPSAVPSPGLASSRGLPLALPGGLRKEEPAKATPLHADHMAHAAYSGGASAEAVPSSTARAYCSAGMSASARAQALTNCS